MNNTPEDLYLKHAEESAMPTNLEYLYLFSQKAADNYGYIKAQTLDGKEFSYTAMYLEGNEANYGWDDTQVVGKFMKEEVRYIGRTEGNIPLKTVLKTISGDTLDIGSQIVKLRRDVDISTLGLDTNKPKNK